MNPDQIRAFLEQHEPKKVRTIVIVDFANVDKWKTQLGWKVGIQELAKLVKHFSTGTRPLRRFYYGADCGARERMGDITEWSNGVLTRANMNGFEVVQKMVKYIHDSSKEDGYERKCDLDVEMAVDMIRLQESYDHIVVFSGDGDLAYVLKYLHDTFGKTICVFGARGHIGKEIVDAHAEGTIARLFHVEDFEYRLSFERLTKGNHQGGKVRRFRPFWKK